MAPKQTIHAGGGRAVPEGGNRGQREGEEVQNLTK